MFKIVAKLLVNNFRSEIILNL